MNNSCQSGICRISRQATAQEKVTAEWNKMAGEWDDLAKGYAHGCFRLLRQKTELEDWKDALVLDFGCGTGLLTALIRKHCHRVVAVDASSAMVEQVNDKIICREWDNVEAYCAVLAISRETWIEELYGKVDLVVASSVMTFIPPEDMDATMRILGKMLKPNGTFFHTDWPKSEVKHPEAMDQSKADTLYAFGGLQAQSTEIVDMDVGGETVQIFVGLATKPTQYVT